MRTSVTRSQIGSSIAWSSRLAYLHAYLSRAMLYSSQFRTPPRGQPTHTRTRNQPEGNVPYTRTRAYAPPGPGLLTSDPPDIVPPVADDARRTRSTLTCPVGSDSSRTTNSLACASRIAARVWAVDAMPWARPLDPRPTTHHTPACRGIEGGVSVFYTHSDVIEHNLSSLALALRLARGRLASGRLLYLLAALRQLRGGADRLCDTRQR